MKIITQAACLVLYLSLACPVCATPPEQCLEQISTAIDTGDAEAFAQLIDVEQIMNNGLEMFMAEAQKPENSSQLAPMLALLFSQASGQGGQAIRGLLLQEAKSFVLNGVSSGAFAGKQLGNSKPQGMLAPLFANASLGRKEIRGVGAPVADDDGWYMPFTVHDYGNGQDYGIVGRFEPSANSARLVRIENLDQIFHQIQKEATGD